TEPTDAFLTPSLAFSPDGKRLALPLGRAEQAGAIKVLDAATGRELLTLRGHAGSVRSVAFNADGTRLVSTESSDVGKASAVKVWDAVAGRELLTLRGLTGRALSAAFSADGTHLYAGALVPGEGCEVKVWDATPRAEADRGP